MNIAVHSFHGLQQLCCFRAVTNQPGFKRLRLNYNKQLTCIPLLEYRIYIPVHTTYLNDNCLGHDVLLFLCKIKLEIETIT